MSVHLALPEPLPRTAAEELERLERILPPPDEREHHRLTCASLLLSLDRYDAALGRLETPTSEANAFRRANLLGQTRFFRRGVGDLDGARAAFVEAGARAPSAAARAGALTRLGQTLLRQDEAALARRSFEASLASDLSEPYARLNLALIDLRAGDADGLLSRMDALVADGVANTAVLISQRLARAAAGAHELSVEGLLETELETPAGWPSLEAFNAELAEELIGHPAAHPSRIGGERGERLRIDGPWLERSRCVPALIRALAAQIAALAGSMQGADPWLLSRPAQASLSLWGVLTKGDGHDPWHAHLHGWLSGVYYVRTPPVAGDGGAIELGAPDLEDIGALPGERRRVRPYPGLLLLFPSYLHHRTWPSLGPDWRVCVAFDVRPD